MRSDVRRIHNYWTDVLVVLDPRAYAPETIVRVVCKLRGGVGEWPCYGQLVDTGTSVLEPLAPL